MLYLMHSKYIVYIIHRPVSFDFCRIYIKNAQAKHTCTLYGHLAGNHIVSNQKRKTPEDTFGLQALFEMTFL